MYCYSDQDEHSDNSTRDSLTGETRPGRANSLYRCYPLEFITVANNKAEYHFKILIIGDSYVGKTSFLDKMCSNKFSQSYSSTVGVDFQSKFLRTEDMKVVSLQIWDTAGQERFRAICKSYYRGVDGVILMYDIGQEQTFLSVKNWFTTLKTNTEGSPPKAVLMVGNKVDLDEAGQREVLTETGQSFAKNYGAEFIETSAMTGFNVADSLLMLVRAIKDNVDGVQEKNSKTVEQFEVEPPITLTPNANTNSKKDSSCICSLN